MEIEKAKFKLGILRHALNCENFTEYKMLFDDKEISNSLDKAIKSLQEKADRDERQAECKYCHGDLDKRKTFNCCNRHLIFVMEDVQKPPKGESFVHCPMCGRKLVQE